jgi:hypothetical protein
MKIREGLLRILWKLCYVTNEPCAVLCPCCIRNISDLCKVLCEETVIGMALYLHSSSAANRQSVADVSDEMISI